IGADGARSLVRDYVTRADEGGTRIERTYSGYTNFNGLVPVDERIGSATQWTTYVADGKRCAVMPVAGDRFYFFVDIPQPSGL
ncbi:monooxygenase, partial [Acinetobacter baumannii]